MMDKTTTYNLMGRVEVAIQDGTEEVDLSKLIEKPTTLVVKSDNVDAQIEILPAVREDLKPICRIGLIIREQL